jgi:hypothetical protein
VSKAISVLSIRRFTFFFFCPGLGLTPRSIAVHPAGTMYASGGEDGFVRVHHFDDSYFKTKLYGELEIED